MDEKKGLMVDDSIVYKNLNFHLVVHSEMIDYCRQM